MMKKEYDFSRGTRGKFYRPKAKLNLPVYLDLKVQSFVQKIAESRRSDISTVVNDLLKPDIQLAESMRYKPHRVKDIHKSR